MPKALSRTGIVTPGELHRLALNLARRTARINTALQAMKSGELLCLEYRAGRPHWSLSNGRTIHPDIAEIITSNASVTPASDALFDCVPAQTWKLGASNG